MGDKYCLVQRIALTISLSLSLPPSLSLSLSPTPTHPHTHIHTHTHTHTHTKQSHYSQQSVVNYLNPPPPPPLSFIPLPHSHTEHLHHHRQLSYTPERRTQFHSKPPATITTSPRQGSRPCLLCQLPWWNFSSAWNGQWQ